MLSTLVSAALITGCSGGTGVVSGYGMSGVPCDELDLDVDRLHCMGREECKLSYRSNKVAALRPALEDPGA
ncbi:MAG: hypothetical protein ACXIUM_03680 [Wenzhouxiangella sp.]